MTHGGDPGGASASSAPGGSSGSSPPATSGLVGSSSRTIGLGSSSKPAERGSGSRKGGLQQRGGGGWPLSRRDHDSDGLLTDEESGERLVSFKMLMKKGGTREEGKARELLVGGCLLCLSSV